MKNLKINWKNHLIELLVVFIGISGAFALNNWNEARQNRELEKKYLTNMYSEINSDINTLSEIIESTSRDTVHIRRLLKFLASGESNLDTILPILNIMSSAQQFTPRNITYESIKSSGGLQILSNFDLRNLIIENYLEYDKLKIVEEVIFEFLKFHWMPYSLKQFDIAKGKIVNQKFVREVEFGNMVGGYFSSLNQQLNSYRAAQNKCAELKTALEKELN